MKIIFMGTPDFAVGTLERLLEAGHEIMLVVTQPDKARGRGKKVQYSPVKEAALAHGLEVYQPKRIREEECVAYLKGYEADIAVVVAFGQILPKEILEMPRYGCVNVHASLLPKYRGASPIQWAVIQGEDVTGVTTMRMDEGLDTGDIILQQEVRLREDETGGSLFERLSQAGAELCVKTLEAIGQGTAVYTPQDHEEATHTTIINKQLGKIDWNMPAKELECLVRGLNPWPSAYTSLNGKVLKIWKASWLPQPLEKAGEKEEAANGGSGQKAQPGTVLEAGKGGWKVQAGQGILVLEEVQLEGKRRMAANDFLRGFPVEAGQKFE